MGDGCLWVFVVPAEEMGLAVMELAVAGVKEGRPVVAAWSVGWKLRWFGFVLGWGGGGCVFFE